jgi:hypothetical protein
MGLGITDDSSLRGRKIIEVNNKTANKKRLSVSQLNFCLSSTSDADKDAFAAKGATFHPVKPNIA